MNHPNDGDSLLLVNDDALFGSGPANWNGQSVPTSGHHSNDTDNKVIYNRLHDLSTDGVEDNGQATNVETARARPWERTRGGATITAGARPKVNNVERTGQPINGIVDRTRNKTVKDKENKNKNSNTRKSNTPAQNGQFQMFRNNETSPTWEPNLQYVDYSTSQRRNGNGVKQKKQTMNQNAVRATPEDQVCANDTINDAETAESLHLLNGLDPYLDPRDVSHVYIPSGRPGHVIPPSPLLDSDTQLSELLPLEVDNTGPVCDTSVNRIHNNLWENSKNCNVEDAPGVVQNGANFKMNPLRNDVETDSENLMLACADLPGFERQPGNSSIVQQFPGTSGTNVPHQMKSQNMTQNLSSPGSSLITVPYDISPNEVSRGDLSNFNLDSLQSNLPTDFLFGDGKNSDFYIAQQLQMQFDQENSDLQTHNQFDAFSNYDYLHMTADQRAGVPSEPVHSSHRNTDGVQNRILNDLYDHSGVGDGLSDSLFFSAQNGGGNDFGTISPDVHPDLPLSQHPDPTLSPSNSHCLRGRSLEDENLARILTEEYRLEADEILARQLQEEDVMQQRAYPMQNHGNRGTDINEFRENSEPLYERFNRTWHRPLTVPVNGRSNNVMDSMGRGQSSTVRPLTRRPPITDREFEFLENIHEPNQMGGQYEFNPDLMLDDYREDSLVSINRDPRMLATLLMGRAPEMMIPNRIDLNDYEALWELAEGLGEVKRVGMEHNEILGLPIHKYQGPKSTEDNKTNCLVCLSDFINGEELKTLPCCHFYHVDCIDEWLKRNAVCPVCRQPASQ